MRLIIKETILLIFMVLLVNVLLVEFISIDQILLNEATKILIISLCIQPWVIYQMSH